MTLYCRINRPPSDVIEPLDLPDVKSYLSMRDDDEVSDPFLRESITVARSMLENILPFFICQGTVSADCYPSHAVSGKQKIAVKGLLDDIIEVTAMREGRDEETFEGRIITPELIEVDLGEEEFDWIHIRYTVKPDLLDATLYNALLVMIRNRYDRRTENPLTEEVRQMIAPYIRVNI